MNNFYKTVGWISLIGGVYEVLNWIYKVANNQSYAINGEPLWGPLMIIIGVALLYRFRNKKS